MQLIVGQKPTDNGTGSAGIGLGETKIVGGTVADITTFPFMLSLRFLTAHVCGATAIGPNTVVTAAHCLDGGIPAFVVS